MSSFSSVWSRTMSTMTRSTSDTSTSAPHTPSSSSVITGLKASLGSGPFFHAHLQEGQRFDDDAPAGVRYEVSAFAITPKTLLSSRSYPQKSKKTSECEEEPRVLQRHAPEKAANGAGAISPSCGLSPSSLYSQSSLSRSPAKKWDRSAAAAAMASDPTGFWKMVAHAQAAMGSVTDIPRSNHYLTRSQSASAIADVDHWQQAPKMRKQNQSYSPGFGTPVYQEAVENMPAPRAWYPPRGRQLSPIEEVQSFERHGDSASLHSATSAQSNLFIHRSVRRTPSTSTLNSGHSVAPRSPDDATSPHGTSPLRPYGQSRPVAPLPVIPASPRESQNVFEPEPASLEESSMTFPMPVIYPPQAEYPMYQHPQEQDLADLPTPQFAIPPHLSNFTSVEEQDLGEGLPPRISVQRSRTPSLLTRSESVQTELTYLTAQDSAPASRRASAVPPDDLEAGRRLRSPLADGDTTLVGTPAARFKVLFDTLLTKSAKIRKSLGGTGDNTAPDVASTISLSANAKIAKAIAQLNTGLKERAPWKEGNGKPAQVLFWTGFLAPWCWLIGGWLLARSGETMPEGLARGAKEPEIPLHDYMNLRPREQQPGLPTHVLAEKDNTGAVSIWQTAKQSSAELLGSLRGHRTREVSLPSTVRAVTLQGDVPMPILITMRLDPWVTRCRVAAVVSGMFILALCIVALIVLVRSL